MPANSQPAPEVNPNPNLPVLRFQVWVEADDRQVFTCGVYDATSEEEAIARGKERAKKDKYEDSIKIKRFFAELTTEPLSAAS